MHTLLCDVILLSEGSVNNEIINLSSVNLSVNNENVFEKQGKPWNEIMKRYKNEINNYFEQTTADLPTEHEIKLADNQPDC